MLRIGLTGNLGSGKSTVAALFAEHGARQLASDRIGRELMQPREPVFNQIVQQFGPVVLAPDGSLDRIALARLAFSEDLAEDLNRIVHPAVIARQTQLAAELFAREPGAVLIVESALLFETRFASARNRFDRIILVTAPESEKIARFVRRQHPQGEPTPQDREALEAEARRRLALQLPDDARAAQCDHILSNDSSLASLKRQVDDLWPLLRDAARSSC